MDSTESDPAHAMSAPVPEMPPAHAPVFYRIESRKVSLIEYWWGTRSPMVIIAWLLVKVFRIPVPSSTDDPAVETLDDFEVFEDELPESVRKRFEAFTQDLNRLGFGNPIFHAVDDVLHNTKNYLASFAHPRLPVVARLHNRVWAFRVPPKDVLFTEFITAYTQGGFLWTLSSKADMKAPPSCRVRRRENAPPAELWKLHEHEITSKPAPALPAATLEQVRGICHGLHEEVRDFHLKRGVFQPLKAADQRLLSERTVAKVSVEGGSKYPDILAEIARSQNRKSSVGGAIVLLLITLLVFIGVGVSGINRFGRLLALVPILLFHESGHYIAMKGFGYRNLKMFFIPGFGAAVTGRSFNVAGWKKVVVYLMGPLPGIFVGIIIGVCGIIWHWPVAVEAGLLAVAINGFNLIPILPLDGGQVVHQLLFSRHYVMDIIFRAAAALALVAVGAVTGGRFTIFIAVGLFVTLPTVVRVAEVARELKREGFKPVSSDDQTIPPQVAEVIIDTLKAKAKRPVPNKMVAEQTLQVFETLNTRPPGWFASLGLGTLHLVSFTVAVVAAMVFAMAGPGTLGSFMRAAANQPRHTLVASAIQSTPPPAPPPPLTGPPAPMSTVVATFDSSTAAAQAYTSLTGRLDPKEHAMLVGDTILIDLPEWDTDRRQAWLDEFSAGAPKAFVHGEHMSAAFRFQAIAPDEATAKAIEEELKEYFALPLSEGMTPPWSVDPVSPQIHLARKTWDRLQSIAIYNDPQMKALTEKRLTATRRGDGAAAKAIAEQQHALSESLHRKKLEEIAADPAADGDLAREYQHLYETLKPGDFYITGWGQMSPRLGQAQGDPTCSQFGYCSRASLLLQISQTFDDPGPGAKAFTDWLSRRGVKTIRYEVTGTERGYEDEEPDS